MIGGDPRSGSCLIARSPSWVCLGLLTVLAGCDGLHVPTAPSNLTEGIAIYEHANFRGESALLTQNAPDLSRFEGPCANATDEFDRTATHDDWNNCISSVRVAPGWRAILYRDWGYEGQSVDLTADAPNLQLVPGTCSHDGLNDCITSIHIIPPGQAF